MFKRWPCALLPLYLVSCLAMGQGRPIQIHGNDEHGLVLPQLPNQPGQDPAALQEVTAYRGAIGAQWNDLEGQGSIIYDFGGGADVNGSAHLELKVAKETRLDTVLNGITASLRIQGLLGQLQSGDSPAQTLDPTDAAASLFAFVHLQATSFPSKDATLKDKGSVTVNGQALHLITYAQQMQPQSRAASTADDSWSVDFYFDPATHLLVKTATIAHSIGRLSQSFVQVMTYSDYHQVNGAQIPFTYSESADGEHLWTMTLSEVQTAVDLQDSDFKF